MTAPFVFPLLLCALSLVPFRGIRSAEPLPSRPMIGNLPVAKVLFLGNSITLHGPAPEIGWTGNWGMAASAEEKDYAHLLVAGLAEATGEKPRTMVRNIADFERAYASYDLEAGLAEALEFKADLVVVAIGENVEEPATEEARAAFRSAFGRLLGKIARPGGATVFVRGCFWPNAVKDGILRAVSAEAGAVFVEIGGLGGDPANKAPEFGHPGVAGHPGDRGMRAIADALYEAIRRKTSFAVRLRGEATSERAPHGDGNVYAPEIHRDGDRWLMWYGGQGRDGHDRIHLAESTDGRHWTRRGVVLDCGAANHVNDPSVVRVGDLWWMFHTIAKVAEEDEIAVATSSDGVAWEKRGLALRCGNGNAWDSRKVGRPSVLHEDGVFRLWFDGQPTPEAAAADPLAGEVERDGRAVGYAESRDGSTWQRRPEPVFRGGAGAIHVSRTDGDRLVMLIESGVGVHWADSRDGVSWVARGPLLAASGGAEDRFGCVTPFLHRHNGQATVYYGAANRKTWDGNAIATAEIAWPD